MKRTEAKKILAGFTQLDKLSDIVSNINCFQDLIDSGLWNHSGDISSLPFHDRRNSNGAPA
ncbi:hypothetical protein LACPH_001398 [Lacticaseibacillus parahuelsenbergensis]|uniref:Uncharacterized protein n=1 Tax=Lacticaseibacillus parahuelsenbergensis TaxID=3068305 RepID=A0ABY9L6Z0_9LACO|nr:hypothetical protein [Lacticaseibacillus sp. NCIMB 15471]WLV79491.1 hypothetical protein LACPH_001398 [Lacticaseibacillus sp. NCIMB 15471]